MIKIRLIYSWVFFSQLIVGWGNLSAQPATITVKTTTESQLKDLNCYWIKDNFEFFNYTPLQKQMAPRKENRFTIAFDKGMGYRYITLKEENEKNSNKILLFDYLVCPGDQIIVRNDDNNGLTFSGKGAGKFTLQYQLSRIEKAVFLLDKQPEDTISLPEQTKLSPVLYNKLKSLLRYNYAKRDSQLLVLDEYKGQLGRSVYQLLKLNVIGRTEQTLLKHLRMEFYRLSHEHPELGEEKPRLLECYMRRNTRLKEVPGSNFLYANELQMYFMERMKYKDWLGAAFHQEWGENAIGIASMDRVLYRHFYRNYSKIEDVQRQEILSQISGLKYKKSIQTFLKNIAYGAIMPDFHLQDTSGNLIHLSDFAGKIIILDFWYTGCGNCRILNENMKPIKEGLKDRKDLIFVNVSIDANFQQWKKSVSTGAYTASSDVSLYTMGKKSLHPLVTFFNVMSYPRQVVIDKEMRIAETQVPRVGNAKNDAAFRALIARLQ